MTWAEAVAALRSHLEAQWSGSAYAATPLVWENETYETDGAGGEFVFLSVEGVFADKTIYGGSGKRSSTEGGLIFFTAFVPQGVGTARAMALVGAITGFLELQHVGTGIYLEGANPASPADSGEVNIPGQQPGGMYYRLYGSVPFIVVSAR